MYQLQEKPDNEITLENGARVIPLATLKNEHDGVAQVAISDHCYVLYLGHSATGWRMTPYWFSEAVAVLKNMPLPN